MEIEENGAKIILNRIDTILEFKRKSSNKIAQLQIALKEEKEKLHKFNSFLSNTCSHSWIDDHIDSMAGYKLSIPIRYCEYCEMNYKTFLSITK